MTAVFLIILSAWLLVLTILFAGLLRHVAALEASGGATSTTPEGGFNVDTDGPWIPSPVPDRAVRAFADAGITSTDLTVIFFSAGCGRCLERATALIKEGLVTVETIILITGNRTNAIADLRRILDPAGPIVVLDPFAHDIVKSLDIQSTPFGFRIADGQVVGKAYIRDAEAFRNMLVSSDQTEGDMTGTVRTGS